MGYQAQVGKRKWQADLDDLSNANRQIIQDLKRLRQIGMSGQAARYLANIAIQVADQGAAIGDLRDIAAHHSENGDEP